MAVEDHIGVIVRANPGITGPEIVKYMKTARGINVGCKTAFRAKCKALGRTAESNRDGFKVLQSLLDQLGSTKGVHTDVEVSSEQDNRLNSLVLCAKFLNTQDLLKIFTSGLTWKHNRSTCCREPRYMH